MAATPEPEEEEKTPATETEVAPEVDMEVWMQRIRSGWTLTTAAGITIGELYLIVSLELQVVSCILALISQNKVIKQRFHFLFISLLTRSMAQKNSLNAAPQ